MKYSNNEITWNEKTENEITEIFKEILKRKYLLK